jgi:fructose 1,6-bisphosphatase
MSDYHSDFKGGLRVKMPHAGEAVIVNDELIIQSCRDKGKLILAFIGDASKYRVKRIDREQALALAEAQKETLRCQNNGSSG